MITDLDDLRRCLKADLLNAGLERYGLREYLSQPQVSLVRLLRYCEFLKSKCSSSPLLKPIYFLARLRYQSLCNKFTTTLPLGVFDAGLSIAHLGTIAVNADSRVGANCRLHQGVTIGAVHGKAPVVGDNLFLGPNSGIYGDITIGDNVIVGAGAILRSNLASNHVVESPHSSSKLRKTP